MPLPAIAIAGTLEDFSLSHPFAQLYEKHQIASTGQRDYYFRHIVLFMLLLNTPMWKSRRMFGKQASSRTLSTCYYFLFYQAG